MYPPYHPSHYPLVEAILNDLPTPYSLMMTQEELRNVLRVLQDTLNKGVEGAVVELGCNIGQTSVLIRKLLDLNGSNKEFHVYDSFAGLPPLGIQDWMDDQDGCYEGELAVSPDSLLQQFQSMNLNLPHVHRGFFSEIPDERYPSQIAFAFFDGDLYESIYDSFVKVYPKLVAQGAIVIDDWTFYKTPGVRKACKDYFRHKIDYAQIMYQGSNQGFVVKREFRSGFIQKWSHVVEKILCG